MKTLKRQFATLIKSSKFLVPFYYLANMISAGILPIIAVIMPRMIINMIESSTQNEVIIRIIILTSISLFLSIISIICRNKLEPIWVDVRLGEFEKVYKKYMDIDFSNLEDSEFNDKFNTYTRSLSNDNDGYEGAFRHVYAILPLLITSILTFLLLGFFNILVIFGCLLGAGLGILSTVLINRYRFKKRDQLSKEMRKLDYFIGVTSDFSYGKDIRIYDLKEKLKNKTGKRIESYITVVKDIANKRFSYGLLSLLGLLLQDSIAYFFVIKSFYDGLISAADVAMYIPAIISLSTSLREIFRTIADLSNDVRYTKDYYSFIDSDELTRKTNNKEALSDDLEIEFRNVSFKYPKTDKYILKDFNFMIKKNEKLAIVGLNGCGKTTFVKLLTGLFNLEEGDIFINGINLKEFSPPEYRKMFSVVFQDTHLYAASVLENVIGNDKSKEAFKKGIECLEKVGLKEKIESLPNKYDHQLLKVIDETGVELSGGEIQKLAIARALYKNGNAIILDEPTAALDALAEADIYKNFDSLVDKKTSIYISHRLTSTKFCDKIALFEDGGVKEYGSHDELMALKGTYYDLFITQGKYYQEEVFYEETI
ncbi:ABC transporter ATP-binding protein/permease [Acholeplasma sp. OttesenSCG-928-E16]|nr:ABC transporter ATP-binding protein/permease [Acholeplasma sp. OttesenSCG-928-E16]